MVHYYKKSLTTGLNCDMFEVRRAGLPKVVDLLLSNSALKL